MIFFNKLCWGKQMSRSEPVSKIALVIILFYFIFEVFVWIPLT